MYHRSAEKLELSTALQPAGLRSLKVRITKKIRTAQGVWQFISLQRVNSRYVWDKREGYYYIEWWEGRRRCRQSGGTNAYSSNRSSTTETERTDR